MSTRNYQLNDDNVLELLGATNNEATDVHPKDPLTNSRIRVTLDQLKPYDKNPRTSRNPKFDEILTAIENVGLEQPPNITRRSPDDPNYMILDGGNTRLEILNVLHTKYLRLAKEANTEEERLAHTKKAESFFVIDCVFKPWVKESRALTGHMSENENRGGMLFIEKALAIQNLRRIYEEEDRKVAQMEGREFDGKPLSTRALASRITADGWTINHSHITRYDYAANTLLKGISEAFWGGAGEPLVRELRKYESAYTRYWQESEVGQSNPKQIETCFFEALREADGESFYTKGFVRYMNERLAKLLDRDPNTVSIEVGAILSGAINLPTSGEQEREASPLSPGGTPLSERLNQLSASSQPKQDLTGPKNATDKRSRKPQSDHPSRSKTSDHTDVATDRDISHTPVWPHPEIGQTELVTMIMERVRPIAERYEFDVFEITQDDIEAGSNPFFIKPTKRVFQPQQDDEAATAWWHLTKFSYSAQLDRANRYDNFERTLGMQYRLYIEREGTIGALLYIEECALGKIDPALNAALFEIQRLCTRYVQQIPPEDSNQGYVINT
jgi:ParB family protein of integrating conjugative element (PFGI_1 class)